MLKLNFILKNLQYKGKITILPLINFEKKPFSNQALMFKNDSLTLLKFSKLVFKSLKS